MLPSLRRGAFARARIALVIALAALAAVLPVGVAHADPSPNDDFDSSTVVATLPFTAHQDTGEATKAPDDPSWCQTYDIGGTVWFSYTPTEDLVLRATTAGSDHWNILAAHTGTRGELRGMREACDIGTGATGATITFRATAGTTYHFMVAGYDVPGGDLTFGLTSVPAAPNDAFATAEAITGLPSSRTPDLSTASYELDEPSSNCAGSAVPSVWYSFTATATATLTASLDRYGTTVAVYTGDAVADLRLVDCTLSQWDPAVFRATQGVTYHLRVAGRPDGSDTVGVTLAEAPALQPGISTSGNEPTIYEATSLYADFWDSLRQPLVSAVWDFGDGATATETGQSTSHLFAADGDYRVGVTITTVDGRTGTTTRTITVSTHDVAITKFTVPTSAKAGQSKPITVQVADTRYRESATVELYKSDGTYWQQVGALTLDVPARPTRKVDFPFSYTFTPDDAVVGKVAFRAVVRLPYPVRDARPMDNEVIAIATTVKPGTTAMKSA